jgi:ATP-dependent exoDNAse (exonuclease V) beta subunit
MPSGWRPQRPDAGVPVPPHEPPRREAVPFDWALETAKHVGVVAHRLLAQVAGEGLASWNDARVESMHPRIRTELAGEGVDDAALDRAAAEVATAVRNAIADPRGRFVLDASHADAASEWALAGIDDGAIVHVVLDRTFVADGVRWIVDFKTGRHEGADVDAFLASEVARYSPQLERYARLVRALDTRPIRLALYYPLLRALRDWPYAG